MIEPSQELDANDLERIARLHLESLDDSLPGAFGRRFTERLYRFFGASPSETLLLQRVDGRIEGVCVVSFAPETLSRRIVRATLPALAGRAAVAVATSRAVRSLLRSLTAEALRGSREASPAPEITYLFTDRARRGRGLGRQLLERAEAHLRKRGEASCFVKTVDDPSNRAIAFYEERGYAPIGKRVEGGRRFVELHKEIPPSEPLPERLSRAE